MWVRFLSFLFLFVIAVSAAGPRVRVLLDTDAYNEIDDQYFLAYSLAQPRFEIEGIAAAQYRYEQGSVDESYFEILHMLEIMSIQPTYPVVRGADGPMRDEKSGRPSPAVDLIARLARKKDPRPLHIVAVGALTNVASALVLHPEIRDKVRVIWLGGFPPDGNMREFNANNDRAAVKTVFESGVQVTVVPAETSARHLILPYDEADKRLRHTNRLGETLRVILRDYGLRRTKVIWDIAATAYLLQESGGPQYFEMAEELAPRIDLAAGKYVRRQGPHKIRVCGMPSRDAIFADFFRNFPQPRDIAGPYLFSALATGDLRQVRLLFSEPVDPRTARDPKCYTTNAAVLSAHPTGATVTLNLERPIGAGAEIVATCVRDAAGNAMLSTRNRAPVHTEARATPGIQLRAYRAAKGLDRVPAPYGLPFVSEIVPGLDWTSPALPAAIKPEEGVLLIAEGDVYLPLDRRYEFTLQSFRLARIFLDGELLLDQGNAGDRTAARTVFRKSGVYRIRVEQYVDAPRFGLTFQWNLPFHDRGLVSDQAFLLRVRE